MPKAIFNSMYSSLARSKNGAAILYGDERSSSTRCTASCYAAYGVYDNPGDMLADISYFTKSNKSDFG
jgi:hypothetical protein